jgi:hypothetical protein
MVFSTCVVMEIKPLMSWKLSGQKKTYIYVFYLKTLINK